MGDFSYLGASKLALAASLIASADAALARGDMVAGLASLRSLLDDCFDGGGEDGPDDGAVDQLVTVVEALSGDEDQVAFLRASLAEDNQGDVPQISWPRFLQSYALDDLRDLV